MGRHRGNRREMGNTVRIGILMYGRKWDGKLNKAGVQVVCVWGEGDSTTPPYIIAVLNFILMIFPLLMRGLPKCSGCPVSSSPLCRWFRSCLEVSPPSP